MGYNSDGASQEFRDENDDDEEEYEEDGRGGRLLGFMFGNVDDLGDLDVDYLDEDAKEHLAALSDKLGPSFTDMDLSVKLPRASIDAVAQDYDEKAENAVNYFDIDEDFEGPEIQAQAATEEDHLLPREEYLAAKVSVDKIREVEHEVVENYDEESEQEEEHEVVQQEFDVLSKCLAPDSKGEKSSKDGCESLADHAEEFQKVLSDRISTPLPVLCIEDGVVILRFSEIFGTHVKKGEKRNHRYSVPKSRHRTLDVSDIIEEDEEAFLKGIGQGFTSLTPADAVKHDISELNDDDLEFAKFGVVKEATSFALLDGPGKGTYLFAEPMKEDLDADPYVERQSPLCSTFYPLDQQDWEDGIVWDKSPVMSHNSVESCEISGPDKASVDSETESDSGSRYIRLQPQKEPDEKDHNILLHSWSSLLEPFGSRNSAGPLCHPFLESRYHPQLLRLESRFEVDDLADGRLENVGQKLHRRQYSKLTSQNRDMLEGSWLDQIIWDPDMPIRKPKLILDLEDEQMLFEILDNKDSEHLKLHSGATIVTPPLKSSNEDSLDLPSRGGQFCWRYVANDKHYSNRKTSHQLKSNSKKRTAQSIKIYHSQPALLLQTMKLKLSNKDVANFHRPKALWYPCDNEKSIKQLGKLPTQGPMKIIIKSLVGKGSKLHVDHEETVFSVKAKASKKLDFKSTETVKMFYKGRELEDDKSLAAQKVQWNSLLYLVRTKIYLLPRSQKLPGGNKSLRPPGAFKKKSDLSVKDGHVFLVEYCEERPLLLSNIGMGARLCTYYKKSAPDDQTGSLLCNENSSLGHVISLNPADKSPFLGDTKAGCSQSSLETNMYRAPLFPHKVPSTDYLLVRSAKGKLSIRRIDKLDVAGQQEPLMKVMSPGTKNLKSYMLNRLLVYMCREFHAAEKHHFPPCIRADELRSQFPYLSDPFIKNKLKELVNLPKGSSGHWVKKSNFRIFSEDELRNMVKPEEVCAYESMQAGLYRLKHLRITETHPSVMSSAMSHLRDKAITLAAASHIERELQKTPWKLSCNFVACTMGKENIERLEISGLGDPSGRGLGFSYVRADPKSYMSNAAGKKNCSTGRGNSESFSRVKCQEIWERQVHSLSAVGDDKNESDSERNNSDLDSFAGCLENLLDAEECERACNEKADGVKGLVMRRLLSLAPAEESEDEAAEATELCRLLMDDETERKKKKKTRVLEEAGTHGFGFENADGVKQIIGATQSDGSYTSKENPIGDSQVMENLLERSKTGELKRVGENDTTPMGLMHKKLKISGDVKMFSEKKSPRGSFVCGACGQLGHMRTNKNCPKYGEDLETHLETPDLEKALGKSISLNSSSQFQQKTTTKRLIPKNATKITMVEASEVEKLGPSSKVVPLTCKGALTEKFPDKQAPGAMESSGWRVTSDPETGKPTVKVSKIIISNKMKPGGVSVESHKPPIGIWPPTDTDKGYVKSPKPTIVIRPPATTDRDQVESQKPSVAKQPLVEAYKEQHHEEKHKKQNIMYFANKAAKKKAIDDRRWGEEQEKRRIEESAKKLYEKEIRMAEEQERLAELKNYEAAIRREREEEELQKAKKNKMTKRRPQIHVDYLEDSRTRRFVKRMPERDQGAKRRPTVELGRYCGASAPTTKRLRGGEVGLANILERIVESLKDGIEISYLFLKPVSKKEAPDYLDIIEHPMDLSTIKEKVRKMEYKSREQFRRDVWQIAFNAHRYNDERNPCIPPLADQLLELCDYMLVEKEESLTEAEAGIEDI